MSSVQVKAFFHSVTSTLSYIVYDAENLSAAIIDSALDYDSASGRLVTEFADRQLEFIRANQLNVVWILETHAHADHLSAAHYLKKKLMQAGQFSKVAIGENITQIQQTFASIFDLSDREISRNGDEFDCLLQDGQILSLGQFNIEILATPGHTPDGVSYLVDGNLFVGDTLFMPDAGTARCDFPGGNAKTLYQSIERIYALPDETKIWMCHDYQPNQRELAYFTSVKESKTANIHVNEFTDIDSFVEVRTKRDNTLAAPKLLYPSLQVNIKAGALPEKSAGGQSFIKIPIFTTTNIN